MRAKTAAINPIFFLGALSLVALLPLKAHADAHSEIVTAMTHADLASKAGDINGVHMHLHHTANCLAGPGGAGYDATQMNPCANSGKGAIPDATAANKAALKAALKTAEAGIAETDEAKAKADATATATALKAIP